MDEVDLVVIGTGGAAMAAGIRSPLARPFGGAGGARGARRHLPEHRLRAEQEPARHRRPTLPALTNPFPMVATSADGALTCRR